jgi:membrane protein DedA with SNARE-associated domain
MTGNCTGLPTSFRESASDTPSRLPYHLTCTKAWPGTTPRQTNCRKIQQITRADIDRAERFLVGRGAWAIPVGRMLPVVRPYTSLGAGLAGVPPLRFGVLSLIGTLAYAAIVASIGYSLGSAWTRIAHDISVAGYAVAAVIVVAIVAFVVYRLRELRREPREAPGPDPAGRRANSD